MNIPQITPQTPFVIPAALLNAIRRYLGGMPHDDVAPLIAALERCEPLIFPQPPEQPNANEPNPGLPAQP